MMARVAQEKQRGRKRPLRRTPVVVSSDNQRFPLRGLSKSGMSIFCRSRGKEDMRSIPRDDGGVR